MINSLFSNEQFRSIYPHGVENHCWNLSRNMLNRSILSRFKSEGTCDVGAGTGIVTAYIKKEGLPIFGVDPADMNVNLSLKDTVFTGI